MISPRIGPRLLFPSPVPAKYRFIIYIIADIDIVTMLRHNNKFWSGNRNYDRLTKLSMQLR